jgi:addiction module HigA family antidote
VRTILAHLDEAQSIEDMRAPAFRLHALKGDRKGYWSVTVKTNWRIVVRFDGGHAYDVDILDDHQRRRRLVPMKNPPHPGLSVRINCLEPLGLSVTEGARVLGISRQALSRLINGKAGVSTDMAIRLAKAFGATPDIWIRMQAAYDVAQAHRRADAIRVERYQPQTAA